MINILVKFFQKHFKLKIAFYSNLTGGNLNKYTYSYKSMKKKALVGDNFQQMPNNNDIKRMLIIIITLRWEHFCCYIISVSISNNEFYNIKRT